MVPAGFPRPKALGLLGIPPGRLRYWERLGLVRPRKAEGRLLYSLADLVRMRCLSRLACQGYPVSRLPRVLPDPRWLAERSLSCSGGRLVLRQGAVRVEVETGQGLLDFGEEPEARVLLHPSRAWAWEQRYARAREGDSPEEVLQALREGLALDPGRVDLRNQEGILLLQLGRAREAAEAFQRALERDPLHPVLRFNLANALDEMGATEEAVRELSRLVGLTPRYADAHYNLAVALEKLGRHREARQHWTRYLRLKPEGREAARVRRHLERRRRARLALLKPGRRR